MHTQGGLATCLKFYSQLLVEPVFIHRSSLVEGRVIIKKLG